MIRNEAEYLEAIRRMQRDRDVAERQRSALVEKGLADDEITAVMEPLRSFHAQLAQEVEWYENVRRRNFEVVGRLTQIGRLLIALRIANGLSQKGLAERLGVSEAVVSRDERNEYHAISVERAQRILDALEATVTVRVEDTPRSAASKDLIAV
jgi:ribosome-binding protein aMBF1 (putative translation factor)